MKIRIKFDPGKGCFDVYVSDHYAGSVYERRYGWESVAVAARDHGHSIIVRKIFDNRADAISHTRVVYIAGAI